MMTIRLHPILRPAAVLLALLTTGMLSAQPAGTPVLLTDAAIARRFQERRADLIQDALAKLDPADANQGWYLDVAAALQSGEKRDAALARFATLNAPTPTANMFWMYPMAAVMAAGDTALDEASRARIAELWRTYWPSRGDTENHWVIYYASLYIAAQSRPGTGPEQWFNGQSAAENMAEARAYIEHWMRVTTTVGQGEYDSPGYIGEYVVPLSLLAGWAEDAAFRQKARMMLDYIFYDYAIEQLNGQYAGAHSRVYPRQLLQPAQVAASSFGWLLFGLGERQPRGQALLLTLSGYTPPPILERIARAADRPYVNRELKRTRWRMRHAGEDAFTVGDRRTVPVYKYSYVDRDFVLGSSQGGLLQPIQQQTWNLRWHVDQPLDASNTFFAVQPYSSPHEGTMFFGADWDTVTDLIARSKADYDSPDKLASGSPHEQVFQHGPALIGLYDLPPGTRFPHIITLFSRDLRQVVEDASGWIFAQGGPVYIAYHPLAAGEWKPNDWTGHLAGGAGGFISAGFKEWGVGHRCYMSGAQHNGYVVQVAPVRDFTSYAAFQEAVRALPLQFSTAPMAEVTFTTLDGSVLHARYGATPTVNAQPVDYAAWPLFESPSGWAERGSQQLELRHGAERYRLDFEHNVITHAIAPAMNPRLIAILLTLVLPAGATAPAQFYAAVAMTKAQKNSSTPTDSGLYRREADGTWVHFGPRILGIGSFAVQPGDPGVLLIPSADGVVRSTDGGRTWRKTTGWDVQDVRSIAFDPLNPKQVYGATQWGPIRSADAGATWQTAQSGLAKLYTQTVIADRTQSGRALIGTEDGIYVTTDAAKSWTRVASSPVTTVLRLAQSAADPQVWLAGTQHRGAWLSGDGGRTWTPVDPGSATANLYAAALNPHDANQLAVGGWNTGVRVSADGGATWTDRSAGLPVNHVFVLAFDPDSPGRLWASTFEEGTFYSDDLGLTWREGGLYGAYGSDFIFISAARR